MFGYLIDQRQRELRKQSKKDINLANIVLNGKPQAGVMLISPFHCHPQELNAARKAGFLQSARGRDSLRQAILYDYNNKNNEKQVKETVPSWSQIWLPLF